MKAMRSAILITIFVTTNAFNPNVGLISFDLNKCRTLRGGPGQCVPLTKCPKITSQLVTERSSISFVLQGDRCGSRFGQTYACCPLEKKTVMDEPYEFESSRFTAATTRRTTARDFDFADDRVFGATTRRTTARDFDNYERQRTTRKDFDKWTRTTDRNFESAATTRTTVRDFEQDFRSTTNASPGSKPNGGGNSNRRLLPTDSCGIGVSNKILGGERTEIDEFPWMALLQYRRPNGKVSFDCSGVLINSRYVLTAAHCVNGSGMASNGKVLHKVRLGEWDLNTRKDCQGNICNENSLVDMEIESVIAHPDYKQGEKEQTNDIALIRFKKEAKLNQFVQPICLPTDSKNFDGKYLTVSGWGRTSNARGSSSNIKLKVKVPVIEWSKCSSFYEQFYGNMKLSKTQMCAGGEKGKDSCQGDSGGPLMDSGISGSEIRWVAVGIVSSGPAACGVEDRPSIYTKVSDFMDWILNNIKD